LNKATAGSSVLTGLLALAVLLACSALLPFAVFAAVTGH
jgi:hypothetical protein